MNTTRNQRFPSRGAKAWAMILGFAFLITSTLAQESAPSEPQVKAAFLVNFPKYVDWPAEALVGTNSPIVVAIFGKAEFEEELKKMTAGRAVHGRPLTFRHVTTEDEIAGCHILFLGNSERTQIPGLLGKLKAASILTVSDSDDFLDQGGVIRLARRDRKIRLEVNLTAASQARLKISSKLLGVADVVKGKAN